jgi:GH24 family phage-related lysozyme (muramidase)
MIMNSSKPSAKTLALLLNYEVGGGQKYYEKYLSKFTWPKGSSGPTIAIGVDCGYYTPAELQKIFSFLPSEQIELIEGASGKTGAAGKQYTIKLRAAGITVSWEQAEHIFETLTWPKFSKLAEKAFPGLADLHEDAYGAIVSLVFNRGTSMRGDSRREMRVIKMLVPDKQYSKIAAQLRSMKRIWEGKELDGLLERRDAEASLVASCA